MLITCGKLFIITLVINDIFEKVPIFDLFRVYNIFHIHVNTFLSIKLSTGLNLPKYWNNFLNDILYKGMYFYDWTG